MKKRVYMSGALTGVPDNAVIKDFYVAVGELCQKLGLEVYVPHINGTDPIVHPDVTPSQVFEIDVGEVRQASLVVAYVGIPSFGVGMELAYAERFGHPIVLLSEKGCKISRFVLGIPTIVKHIEFENYEDALRGLEVVLTSHFK